MENAKHKTHDTEVVSQAMGPTHAVSFGVRVGPGSSERTPERIAFSLKCGLVRRGHSFIARLL